MNITTGSTRSSNSEGGDPEVFETIQVELGK